MQESKWTSAISWAAKKAASTLSSIFTKGPVLVVTFVVQLPTAFGDYCFNVPRLPIITYNLACDNAQQLINLSKDLITQANATTLSSSNCSWVSTANNYTVTHYGTTYFGYEACDLSYYNILDPLVNSTLANNVKNGIFGGPYDELATALIVLAPVVFTSLITAACCIHRSGKKDHRQTVAQETDRLISTDNEAAVAERGKATTRTITPSAFARRE